MISQINFALQNIGIMEDYKHSELTGKIIGCAMKVHRVIGPGFPEIIYMRCLCIELKKAGLNFETEVEKDFFMKE